MHIEALIWLKSVRDQYPRLFENRRVLECGSLNVNGSARLLFARCDYTGLDARPGRDVDVVALAHEYDAAPFDVVVSCEMLEHDPHWRLSLENMTRLLRPGGAMILTWAGPNRPEHEKHESPQAGYYYGVSGPEVWDVLRDSFDDLTLDVGQMDIHVLALGKL